MLFRSADQLYGFGKMQHRLKNSIGDQLGNQVRDPDSQFDGLPSRIAAQGLLQLAPESEDVNRIAIHNLTNIGQYQPAASLLEELFPKGVLQRADLSTYGWLRQAQNFASASNTAFARDRPEIEKVVIVEPLHTSTIHRRRVAVASEVLVISPVQKRRAESESFRRNP